MLGIHAQLRARSVACLRQTTTRPLRRLPSRVAFTHRLLATQPSPAPAATKDAASGSTNVFSAESKLDSPSKKPDTPPPLPTGPKPSVLSRVIPASFAEKGKTASSFRKIIALAKPERKPLAISIGLLVVSSAVSMSIPFTVGRLIDFFTSPTPQVPLGLSLGQASSLLFLMFTVGAAANAGRAMLMRISGQRIVARLRERMYGAALHQEVEYVERGEGDVLSRLSVDSNVVGDSLTQNLSDGLRSVIMSSVGLGAMFYISPKLTFLMLAIVPPVSLGVVFYGRYLKRLSTRTQEALGEMTKVAQESLSALRTVQAFNAVPHEEKKFHEKVNDVLALARKEAIASGIFFGSTGWSGNVTLLGLLGYGGTMVSHGQISVGDLTSLLLYTVYVGSGLQMLTTFFTSIMRGIGAGERIFELLDRNPAVPPNTGLPVDPARRGPIRFEEVYFRYPSRPGVQILKHLDLEVNVGESVALVGQSGSGKSSINALLLRYYDPEKGKVTFDGQDIREFDPASWRSVIGVVPQDPVLFTGTIASNIAYGSEHATREQIEAAAREANCEFVWGMPQGFDTEIGRLSLSGGQRQRLAIARALLKKPAILALDEATSSLDATSEHRVNDAIDKILRSRQTTCLIVAHRLSTIARAERIVVLEDGHVVESGSYRHLVNKEGSRFRALMAAQLSAATGNNPAQSSTGEQ
ncbi:P-loop containing nucleoside triphosphate hydrolase protein [Fomitopsis betulina]|nr:P-loop containing nucleoside triphosphate hydrolase protein [Fomitopsis betulina]